MEIKRYRMLIDGKWTDAMGGGRFHTFNPATGEQWASVPEAMESDIDLAVHAAHKACWEGPWSEFTPTQRGRCLRKLAELLAENSEKLGETETRDTGKLYAETRWQAKYISEFLHFYAGAADKISGETLPIDKPDMFAYTEREPLGVVAAVVPWNSQLFLAAVKIGPALAAGNSIVLKTSEHAPAVLLEFGGLVSRAGIPDGVVNIVTGHGDPCGRVLTSHPLVSRVSFTGGASAARRVIANTTVNFASLSLELGGKSPFIVFPDADIESAVNGSATGIFSASGQSCVAGSRLLVHEDIADEFLDRISSVASEMAIGDPMDEGTQMGPLCTLGQIENIESQVALALRQGAKLICGGRKSSCGDLYYEPTILDCPSDDIAIAQTELFGPVLCVHRFKTESEAVSLANGTEYGLAAGIFTRDNARALRMSRRVRAGIVWVNTYRVISPIAEFGGVKASGYGRESGFQAVYDYTRSKTIWMNMSDAPISNPFMMR